MRGLSLKVSEKRGLSLYGVGRFPVTLYKVQWRKTLGMAGEIEELIKRTESLLKTKDTASRSCEGHLGGGRYSSTSWGRCTSYSRRR